MARPRARELTERELEVMQVFWADSDAENPSETPVCLTAADVRERLAHAGRDLAYTTVATLIRILSEKGYLLQTNEERPFRYQPLRSFEDVSGSLLGDVVQRVFGGSRELLLKRLFDDQELTSHERGMLENILRETGE